MDLHPRLVPGMQGLLPCDPREAEMPPGLHPSRTPQPRVTVGPSSDGPLHVTQAGTEKAA